MKRNVLGVLVDACDYDAATTEIIDAARERRHFAGTAIAVHGIMQGVGDRTLCRQLNSFDLVTPDGQPDLPQTYPFTSRPSLATPVSSTARC